ncbi:hypothetical protein K8R32_04750, partial [bacterium]|nr:hypothetical protein [bacterium]
MTKKIKNFFSVLSGCACLFCFFLSIALWASNLEGKSTPDGFPLAPTSTFVWLGLGFVAFLAGCIYFSTANDEKEFIIILKK